MKLFIVPFAFIALAIGIAVVRVSSNPTPEADPDPGLGWLWPEKEHSPSLQRASIGTVSPNGSVNQPRLNGEEWLQSIRQQSEEELMLLEQGRSSIQKYQANSHDCYKEAASMLQKGCKELTIKQEEKIQYAVRLTMCEVATANMNVPTSCSQANPSSACVEALAQVPQLWTSYSGYFREVMAMCYAVRHQIERELVESLFYNLTLAQLVNTNMLQQHAQDMAALRQQELATLTSVSKAQEELKSHANELGKWATTMSQGVGDISSKMATVTRTVQEIDRAQQEVEQALRSSKEEVMKWIQDVREDAVGLRQGLQIALQDVGRHIEEQQRAQVSMQFLTGVITQVVNVTTSHTSNLISTLTHLNSSLTAHASNLDIIFRSQVAYFQRMSTSIQQFESQQHQAMTSTSAWFAHVQQMHAAVVENMTRMAEQLHETQAKQNDQLDSVAHALKELHEQTEAATSSFGMVAKILGIVSSGNVKVVLMTTLGIVAHRLLGPIGSGVLLVAYGLNSIGETEISNAVYVACFAAPSVIGSLVWTQWDRIQLAISVARPGSTAAASDTPEVASDSLAVDVPLSIRTLQRPPNRSISMSTPWKRYRPSQLFNVNSSQRLNQFE